MKTSGCQSFCAVAVNAKSLCNDAKRLSEREKTRKFREKVGKKELYLSIKTSYIVPVMKKIEFCGYISISHNPRLFVYNFVYKHLMLL